MSEESNGPSTERLFRLLADARRRRALRCLSEHAMRLTLADLADEVAVRERETSIDQIPAEEVKQVYMSLYHNHVPKLVDAGIAEYDQDADTVALDEFTERVERYLDAFEHD
jgi:DNA-binding transcriptional ArsR family regulator